MNLRFTFYTAFLVLILSVWACSKAPIEDPDIVVTTEPEFIVDLYEQRSAVDGSPQRGFWLESLTEYPCTGFEFQSQVLFDSSGIRLILEGVNAPDTCQGSPAKAECFIGLPPLADGIYPLDFSLASTLHSTGELIVQGGEVEWVLTKEEGIDIQNRVMSRIPDGIIWGYVRSNNEQEEPRALAFLNELKTITSAHNLPAGYYSYFSVTGTGQAFTHRSFKADKHLFVRRISADRLSELQQLLESYRDSSDFPIQIFCLSTEGAF
ncbi:MAG: hypothetical protein R2792_02720 [Saprospiraceae bacterium]